MIETPQDIELLKASYEKTIAGMTLELNELKRQIKELIRLVHGSKSERFMSDVIINQLSLFEEELQKKEKEIEKYTVTYKREVSEKKKEQPIRTAIPAHFPRIEEVIEPKDIIPGSVKIGQEITELLEVKPMTIFVRRIIRTKYALPQEQGVIIANLPSLPIPKGNASASLLAFILVSKFVDHLPLYRLQQIFKRQELIISKSTIGGWFSKISKLIEPLYEVFKADFLKDAYYIQADESPIKVQDRDKKKSLHQGYMWVYRNPIKNMILFEYNRGRAKSVPEKFLENFTGYLQSDAYKAYLSLQTKGNITLVGCMAHARRYFEKALDNDPKRAEHVLLLIQKLYAIERKVKEKECSDSLIKRYREICAIPILNEIDIYIEENINSTLPKSSIGIAMAYYSRISDNLRRYVNQGYLEIDNNMTENSIRPLAIGRKNYMFAGSHDAAQNYAMFYSFFATCKKNDINPYKWIVDVIHRLPEHKADRLIELTPAYWKPQSGNV